MRDCNAARRTRSACTNLFVANTRKPRYTAGKTGDINCDYQQYASDEFFYNARELYPSYDLLFCTDHVPRQQLMN